MAGSREARTRSAPRSFVEAPPESGMGKLQPREPVIRYEKAVAGEMVHIDIKKLGRINGVGHRMTGDRRHRGHGGWEYAFVAVDDASRLAYVEVFRDEKAASAITFLQKAVAFFRRHGVIVKGVLHRQRQGVRVSRIPDLVPAAWNQATTNPALSTPNQRQSRALHSNRASRMGLQPPLFLVSAATSSPRSLASLLQSPQTPTAESREPPPSQESPNLRTTWWESTARVSGQRCKRAKPAGRSPGTHRRFSDRRPRRSRRSR